MEVSALAGVAEAIPLFKTMGDSNILRFLALIKLTGVAGLFSFMSMMWTFGLDGNWNYKQGTCRIMRIGLQSILIIFQQKYQEYIHEA